MNTIKIRKSGSGFTVKMNGSLLAACTYRRYAEIVKETAQAYFGENVKFTPAPEEKNEILNQANAKWITESAAAH